MMTDGSGGSTASPNPRIAYLTEADISIDNGRGINEREFIDAALEMDEVSLSPVVPRPERPENHQDDRITYVRSHGHSAMGYLLFMASAYRAIRRLHREGSGLDGLAVRLDVSPLVPLLAHRRLGIPLLIKSLIGRRSFARDLGWDPRSLVSRIMRPLFRATIGEAAGVDVMSPGLAVGLADAVGLNPEDVIVIRNGANVRRFLAHDRLEAREDVGLSRFDTVIGYVGALAPMRHLPKLIRGFAAADLGPSAGLVLVGDGPLRGELEGLVGELGQQDRVVFTGFVPYDSVPSYMSSFDVGVDVTAVPIRRAGVVRMASFSQKIAQYLACGCPVLAWDLPDNRFLVEEDVGWTVPREGEPDLSEALVPIAAEDADRRRRRRRRARALAESELSAEALAAKRLRFWRDRVSDSR